MRAATELAYIPSLERNSLRKKIAGQRYGEDDFFHVQGCVGSLNAERLDEMVAKQQYQNQTRSGRGRHGEGRRSWRTNAVAGAENHRERPLVLVHPGHPREYATIQPAGVCRREALVGSGQVLAYEDRLWHTEAVRIVGRELPVDCPLGLLGAPDPETVVPSREMAVQSLMEA
jgi:hypothetical protein